MTIETDFRGALLAHAGLVARVGDRVAINAVEQSDSIPYVVVTVQRDPQYGLDNTILGNLMVFTLQVWDETSVKANEVADLATAALAASGFWVTSRQTGYDPDTALDAVVLTVEHVLD